MSMNIYEIDTHAMEGSYQDENGEKIYCDIVQHIVAETRGKAHALFLLSLWGNGWCWTDPISIRLLAKNVDLPEGEDEDYVWASANLPNFRIVEHYDF